jgi:uncharacterized membrane protein|tara:strand:+ start:363 stop:533 length:171 start_codon:yes stop_codon:yes gene_type:complete
MSEVVWSINIMLGILLVGVGVAIYYIFMYDTWYPNEQENIAGSESGRTHSSVAHES